MPKHPNYEYNVFINCPFDQGYLDLRKVLIFTITYFDYIPRISLESSDSGASRLEKIIDLIQESKFSVHDLSRIQSHSKNEFFRLNMPFELGIDYGLRRFNEKFKDKKSLIIASDHYEYMKAISDINGVDIKSHNDTIIGIIECLRAWFSETVKLKNLNSSIKILSDFYDFNSDLLNKKMMKYAGKHTATECEAFGNHEVDELTLPEYIEEIKSWKLAQV
jgi:hypothetical protein